MAEWKMPPKAKVYDALSAVADRRVLMKGPNEAEVVSSSGDRTYTVRFQCCSTSARKLRKGLRSCISPP